MRKAIAWKTGFALVLVLVYVFFIRPWYLHWGATPTELAASWPGDELAVTTVREATRAITIDAPPSAIWPWILQIGQDRAGFYSYTWLENLFGAEMHNTYRIVPQFQHRQVGDDYWMTPKRKFGGMGRLSVAALQPERSLVLVHPDELSRAMQGGKTSNGAWNFHLQPIDGNRTRLVMRSLGFTGGLPKLVWHHLFWEPAHFIMERKMMMTIRNLAEGRRV